MSDVGSGNYILLYSGPTAATFLPSQRSRAQAHARYIGLSMYCVILVTRPTLVLDKNTFWSLLLVCPVYFMCVSST